MDKERWLTVGAFAVIYFVWGSTYLANYWAIQTIPPFLMCGVRFTIAGALLASFVHFNKPELPRITARQLLNTALIGILFLAVGTGVSVWGLQFIPSSLAALIVSFNPMVIMILLWVISGIRPLTKGLVGAAISIVGVSLLVGQPQLTGSVDNVKGLMAIGVAMASWAVASIYVSRLDMGGNQIRATAFQMLLGGLLILLYAWTSGDFSTFELTAISSQSGWALVYLVLFGSILAFSAFNYLLMRVSPEKVATSTYVNPLIALLLGGWLNDELITQQSLLAGGIMLTGVYFINTARSKK